MYTIYINEVPLIICKESKVDHYLNQFDNLIVHDYRRGRKGLFNYIDAFEKSSKRSGVILQVENPKETFAEFCSIYKVVEAAGGIVFNKKGDLLAIFRRGHWDLPKGKIEGKETLEETAVREVKEETGIKKIHLKRKIGITYHTYSSKKHGRMLKVSHWYKMKTPDYNIRPQVEEDIEKAAWVNLHAFLKDYRPMYKNISDIIQKYLATSKKKQVASMKV